MGITEVKVVIHGPKGSRRSSLLADTGSSYTWIGARMLTELGVKPIGSQLFKTIDKRLVERPTADVLIEYDSAKRYCPVAFAEKGDANVLGVTAMEIIGLEIDPSTREVRKVTAHAAFLGDAGPPKKPEGRLTAKKLSKKTSPSLNSSRR